MSVKKIKLKSNSSVKKRFKVTARGKVIITQACKRHNMRKRNSRMIRTGRGMTVANSSVAKRIKKFLL